MENIDGIGVGEKNSKIARSVQLSLIMTAIASHVTACTDSILVTAFTANNDTEVADPDIILDSNYGQIDAAELLDTQAVVDVIVNSDNVQEANLEANNPMLETELNLPIINIEEPPIHSDIEVILDASELEFQGFTSRDHGTDVQFSLINNTEDSILTRFGLKIDLSDCDRNRILSGLSPTEVTNELSVSLSSFDGMADCSLISAWALASGNVRLFYTCFETNVEPGVSEYSLHLERNNNIQLYGLGGVDWEITTLWTLLEDENTFSTNFGNLYGTFSGGHLTLIPSPMGIRNLGPNPFFSGVTPLGVPAFDFPEIAATVDGDVTQIQSLTTLITARTLEGRELSNVEVDQIVNSYQVASEFYRPFSTGLEPFITTVIPEERIYNLMFAPVDYLDRNDLSDSVNSITTNIGVNDNVHPAFDIEHPEFNKIILTQEISEFGSNAESAAVRVDGIDIELPYVDIDTSVIRYESPLRAESFGNNATRVFAPGDLLNTSTHIFNTDDGTFCVIYDGTTFSVDLNPCPTEENIEQ